MKSMIKIAIVALGLSAMAACGNTNNAEGTTDSTAVDTATVETTVDTAAVAPVDTTAADTAAVAQ